ncbi:PaaI family thioesterase [Mycobacterium colombiense]|uniref:PaaI family thioesterase n=1 Tax=Mycobacterium colombiense TaxID=339268 RepID=UPI001EE6897B|nr:PaaI family thioesterase [Mycobacterium colombiense]
MTSHAQRPLARLRELTHNGSSLIVSCPNGIQLCLGCRTLNHCRLGLLREHRQDDGTVISEIICPPEYEAADQVAHGRWTAGVLDEIVGHCVTLGDEFVVTGSLKIDFVKPVPISRPLTSRAAVVRREGRRVYVAAELSLTSSGAVLASAHATMVRRPSNHYERHQEWLDGQCEA